MWMAQFVVTLTACKPFDDGKAVGNAGKDNSHWNTAPQQAPRDKISPGA